MLKDKELGALDAGKIKEYIAEDVPVNVYGTVTSTNDLCKAQAQEGAPEYSVYVARAQTAGKGRFGRRFYSPSDTGAYMSLLLCPGGFDERVKSLTALTAVAVAEALEELYGADSKIKWVNDIYIGGRKCAGILTESALNAERLNVVVGIGVNITLPEGGFPREISGIAGAVSSIPRDINELVGVIIKKVLDEYRRFDADSLVARYRKRCLTVGREVLVVRTDGECPAFCVGVNNDFSLEVRYPDGSTENIFTGEVSVRI